MSALAEKLNKVLPQTQCGQCGYAACLPYAEALASSQESAINLCLPGKDEVLDALATLLNKPPETAKPYQTVLAKIDENVCIGCTACIRVCPVDAILGASKLMHTVIEDECSGCALCVPACPVDCIDLLPTDRDSLPRRPILSQTGQIKEDRKSHLQKRYDAHVARRAHPPFRARKTVAEVSHQVDVAGSTQGHAPSQVPRTQTPERTDNQAKTGAGNVPNINQLLANAKTRAANRSKKGRTVIRSDVLAQELLQKEKDHARFRHAQQQLQYGSEAEKQSALVYLRALKKAGAMPPGVPEHLLNL